MPDDRPHFVEHCADDPNAPVIVLVHGVFDSSVSFERVIDDLVPAFSVITYDRRGWARSRDATPASSLDDHAHDLLSAIGERPATVVGHSYGGAVALLAAVRRPDLVAALGLFEPSMQWTPWWPNMETIVEQAPDEQEQFRAGLEGRPRPTPEERARDRALLEHELTFVRNPPFDLRQVVVPRLVGRGGESAQWRVEATDRLTHELACELVVIDDAGHTAHRTQPKAFADFARQAVTLGQVAR
jgi:pimeloyl-ACP methyl ester carboxylesterase